jgi:halocyanin-like protein
MPRPADHERIPDPVPPLPLPEFDYDDIEKTERIGTGGDADVYLGTVEHQGNKYEVAIKEPRFEGTIQRRVVEKFQNEAETWNSLSDHENIVSVYGWGTKPLPWMGLEYMDGGTLSNNIGSLDVAEALWLAGRIAEGIRYGHRHGIAHLDIKPANVLLRNTPAGKWKYPKVSDWGLAKMLLEHSNSIEGISPTYAAPEQFDSEVFGSPDDFTDIYQLGTVVYAMLAGEPPFTGTSTAVMRSVLDDQPDPPSAVNPDLPEAVDDVVLQALAKEKDDRYESVVTFRQELDRLFEELMESNIFSDTAVGVNQSTGSGESPKTRSGSAKASHKPNRAASEPDNRSASSGSAGGTSNRQSTVQGMSKESPPENRKTSEDTLIDRRQAIIGILGAGVIGVGGWQIIDNGDGNGTPSDNDGGVDSNGGGSNERDNNGSNTDTPGSIVPEEVDNHLSDANGYNGSITDMTGEDSVTITNGSSEPDYAFDPVAVRVDPGTEVTWEWVSPSHSVTHTGDAFDSGIRNDSSATFSYTFEETGNFPYYCTPHRSIGQKGAIVVE